MSKHGNVEDVIAKIEKFGIDTGYFIANDQNFGIGILESVIRQGNGSIVLFEGNQLVSFTFHLVGGFKRVARIFPSDGFFCAE